MDADKNELNLELSEKILNDPDRIKTIENTYKSYVDPNVNLSTKSDKTKNVDNIVETVFANKSSELEKQNTLPKKINFDVHSIENLTPELQESIKSLLNSRNNKNEISRLLKEIEIEKNNFLKKQDGLFGIINEKDMEILEKKLAETEVSRKVTEINLTAIVSCLNNIMSN